MPNPLNISRRTLLRGAGVALALPWLDAMTRYAPANDPPEDAAKAKPRRMVCVANGQWNGGWLTPRSARRSSARV